MTLLFNEGTLSPRVVATEGPSPSSPTGKARRGPYSGLAALGRALCARILGALDVLEMLATLGRALRARIRVSVRPYSVALRTVVVFTPSFFTQYVASCRPDAG